MINAVRISFELENNGNYNTTATRITINYPENRDNNEVGFLSSYWPAKIKPTTSLVVGKLVSFLAATIATQSSLIKIFQQ